MAWAHGLTKDAAGGLSSFRNYLGLELIRVPLTTGSVQSRSEFLAQASGVVALARALLKVGNVF